MRLARAQQLTGRATELGRDEARSAVRGRGVPGGSHVRPTRTTETGSRDDRPHTGATSLQTCLVFSAPRPRPSKSPGIHRKTPGRPRAIPECEHRRDWVAERAGFEPAVEFPLHTLSKRAPSTTRTSLRSKAERRWRNDPITRQAPLGPAGATAKTTCLHPASGIRIRRFSRSGRLRCSSRRRPRHGTNPSSACEGAATYSSTPSRG